jgi:hypothetical protein
MFEKSLDDTEKQIISWNIFFTCVDDPLIADQHKWAAVEINSRVNNCLRKYEEKTAAIEVFDECWQFILRLIESAPSRRALIGTATGPLKQLLDQCFIYCIKNVAHEAASSAKLRYCLSHIFLHNERHNAVVYQLGDRCASFVLGDDSSIKVDNELDLLVNAWIDFYGGEQPSERSSALVLDQIYSRLPSEDPNRLWDLIKALLDSMSYSENLQVGNLVSELLDVCCTKYLRVISSEMLTNRNLVLAVIGFGTDTRPEWSELLTEARLLLEKE